MSPKELSHETWLDLSSAAEYLGVHFTTLRRWANSGKISYMRTPGGRRRFSVSALEQFVKRFSEEAAGGLAITPAAYEPLERRAIDIARKSVRSLPVKGNWLALLTDEQRASMRGTGSRLMALLLQYNSRIEGGEAYLDEGRRISGEYGQVCCSAGLSLPETVQVFQFFRRSILDAVHETGQLASGKDQESLRLYHRTIDFLDELMISLIVNYLHLQAQPKS
jgi:excisionase family DNA binding protein